MSPFGELFDFDVALMIFVFLFFVKFGFFNWLEILGWFCKMNCVDGALMREVKRIYASCVLVEKTEDFLSIFLFNKIFEPLYKHEMHVSST